MPTFTYKARGASGDVESGQIEAQDQRSATEKLREKKLIILEIDEAKTGGIGEFLAGLNPLKPKAKASDLVIFSRQLSTLVSAGVPIVQGLTILVEQIENPFFKDVVDMVREDIESGLAIAEALEKHPKVFNELFVNMIKAGELGGILDIILQRMADYLESAAKLKSKVKGAMIYPAVISCIAVTVTLFLLIFVIPTFATIFQDFGQDLPLPTQALISLSEILKKYFLHMAGVLVVGIVSVLQYYKTDNGSRKIDAILLKLPLFGILLKKVAIAKFTGTFGTLVKSGVPILEALDTVAHTSGNRVIEAAVMSARDSIREGEKISDPLERSQVFPPMVMQMISIGEETGNLDIMLNKIADFYDSEVDSAIEGLTSMIEPLIMVVMGLVIGVIVLAIFMPIFDMGALVG